eukprot:5699533-Pyramimonas_sp.AAC.1
MWFEKCTVPKYQFEQCAAPEYKCEVSENQKYGEDCIQVTLVLPACTRFTPSRCGCVFLVLSVRNFSHPHVLYLRMSYCPILKPYSAEDQRSTTLAGLGSHSPKGETSASARRPSPRLVKGC